MSNAPDYDICFRCLLAYYLESHEDVLPWLEVPMHTVIRLEPIAYGCNVQFIKFPVDCANTHRKKPMQAGLLEER
jgi:6-phosphofructo-2-kinase/fructose-2,6-biphosphatase 2